MKDRAFSLSPLPGNNPAAEANLTSFKSSGSAVAHMTLEDLAVGLVRNMSWTITSSDIDAFALLSGDVNPLHVDSSFARDRGFPDRVAHGFLLGAKVSAFVGTVMPGRDCLLLESLLTWPRPCFAGDTVHLSGEIMELSIDSRAMRIKMRAVAVRKEASVVVGRGWVLCQIQS
jgi:3-hydroxybutyryl-CoA dehydratase